MHTKLIIIIAISIILLCALSAAADQNSSRFNNFKSHKTWTPKTFNVNLKRITNKTSFKKEYPQSRYRKYIVHISNQNYSYGSICAFVLKGSLADLELARGDLNKRNVSLKHDGREFIITKVYRK